VDPYYLIKSFKTDGQSAAVMSSARQASENFPRFLAESAYDLMRGLTATPKVLVVGCTFKEDIDDIRNSKVFDFLTQMDIVFKHNVYVTVVDDMADPGHVLGEYRHNLYRTSDLAKHKSESTKFDLVFVNVQHKAQVIPMNELLVEQTKSSGWVMDYKGTVDAEFIHKNAGIRTWGI
jgi:UDP-N-acetyl-D-galactosamine dehydrogenase